MRSERVGDEGVRCSDVIGLHCWVMIVLVITPGYIHPERDVLLLVDPDE